MIVTTDFIANFIVIVWISLTLALINFLIICLFYNKEYNNLLKSRVIYYTIASSMLYDDKDTLKQMINNYMNNSFRTITYAIKPVILEFAVLAFVLSPVARNFKSFELPFVIFGWHPGWFTVYFISYVLLTQVMISLGLKEFLAKKFTMVR